MNKQEKKQIKPQAESAMLTTQATDPLSSDEKMPFFRSVWGSFYDNSVYRQAKKVKMGQVLKVFLAFVLLFQFALSIYTIYQMDQSVDQVVDQIGDELPVLKLNDGVLSSDPQKVYTWQTEQGFLAIDTSGVTDNLDDLVPRDTDQAVVITDRKILVKEDQASSREFSLSTIKGNYTLDKASLTGFVNYIKVFIGLGSALLVLLAPLFDLIQAAVVALFAYSLSRLVRSSLDYRQVLKITLIASIPAYFLSWVQGSLLGLGIPWFAFLVMLAYCFFGIISQEEK